MTDEEAADKHNEIVTEIVVKLITIGEELDCWVAVESLLVGVMRYYRPNPEHAAHFMDVLKERVAIRLSELMEQKAVQ